MKYLNGNLGEKQNRIDKSILFEIELDNLN